MNFNFYEQYKNSSTVDLLLIVKQPGKYQPEAVDAAKMILRVRNVSEAEEQQAVEAINAEPLMLFKKRFKKDEDKSLSELLDPLTDPEVKKTPTGLSIFTGLIVVTLYYTWRSFVYIRGLYYYLTGELLIDVVLFISLIDLAIMMVMVALLWKRHPWGWRLLLGYNLFTVLNVVLNSVLFSIGFEFMTILDIAGYFIPAILQAVLLFLIWKDEVAIQFSIYKADKIKALKWGSGLFALIAVIMFVAASDVKIFS